MDKGLIARINALAKKKREEGLSPEESAEQKELYKIYLKQFREGVSRQLDYVDIQTPDGKVTPFKTFVRRQKEDKQ